MFDTMTFTKVASSLCGALLVLLLTKWAAEELFHVGSHGGEQAYVIEVESDEVAEAEAEVPFEELMAAADPGDGAKVFRKCSACHKVVDGENGAGPHLYNVVDRPKAAVEGFSYSSALAAMGGEWTVDNLNAFLENPKGYVEGTSMGFNGLGKAEDRAAVIAYLSSVSN